MRIAPAPRSPTACSTSSWSRAASRLGARAGAADRLRRPPRPAGPGPRPTGQAGRAVGAAGPADPGRRRRRAAGHPPRYLPPPPEPAEPTLRVRVPPAALTLRGRPEGRVGTRGPPLPPPPLPPPFLLQLGVPRRTPVPWTKMIACSRPAPRLPLRHQHRVVPDRGRGHRGRQGTQHLGHLRRPAGPDRRRGRPARWPATTTTGTPRTSR